MFEKVVNLLSEYLRIDSSKITRETDIRKDLGADSLVIVEMMFALEDEMGIVIPDEVIEDLTQVGALVDYLESVKK